MQTFDQFCRKYCEGSVVRIQIGRSANRAGPSGAPVVIVEGNQPPTLCGHPFLKTQFSNGRGFTKTLYTPSTRRIEVGKDWQC